MKDLGYLEGDFDQNQFNAAINKFRDEFDINEKEIMKKLEEYTLKDIKYLFSTNMSLFNEIAHPNLKERNQSLKNAIDSQKQDTKPILKRLHLNLKLN